MGSNCSSAVKREKINEKTKISQVSPKLAKWHVDKMLSWQNVIVPNDLHGHERNIAPNREVSLKGA